GVQHRKRAGEAQAHRADVGVRRRAERGGAPAERFGARQELGVDLQTDDGLVRRGAHAGYFPGSRVGWQRGRLPKCAFATRGTRSCGGGSASCARRFATCGTIRTRSSASRATSSGSFARARSCFSSEKRAEPLAWLARARQNEPPRERPPSPGRTVTFVTLGVV